MPGQPDSLVETVILDKAMEYDHPWIAQLSSHSIGEALTVPLSVRPGAAIGRQWGRAILSVLKYFYILFTSGRRISIWWALA